MQLLQASVKGQRQVNTRYGAKTVCDITLPDGTEAALWRPANDPVLTNLQYGQAVTVTKDSKGKINLVDSAPATVSNANVPQSPQAQPAGLTPDTKRAIAGHIEEMASLFNYCYQTAAQKVEGLPPEQTREVATTLFIQASRKFNL